VKLVVFGATGGTGHQLVEQALAGGHHVTGFVRNPEALGITHERLSVVIGDVRDLSAVEHGTSGQDAVLCALGVPAGVKGPVTLCGDGTERIVAAMARHGVRRIVCQTAFSAGESRNWGLSAWMTRRVIGQIMCDKDRQERLLRDSGLDFVIVRPPTLTQGARRGTYRVREHAWLWLWNHVSRADVAEFMLAQVDSDHYVGKAPVVCY
jgi:uncharacterized protein YbjT (DUF2867 family)